MKIKYKLMFGLLKKFSV